MDQMLNSAHHVVTGQLLSMEYVHVRADIMIQSLILASSALGNAKFVVKTISRLVPSAWQLMSSMTTIAETAVTLIIKMTAAQSQ